MRLQKISGVPTAAKCKKCGKAAVKYEQFYTDVSGLSKDYYCPACVRNIWRGEQDLPPIKKEEPVAYPPAVASNPYDDLFVLADKKLDND